MAKIRKALLDEMALEIRTEYPDATQEMVEDYIKCGDEKLSRDEANELLNMLGL